MNFPAILFLGFTLTFFAACSPSKEEQVMKTWKLADMQVEVLFKFEENGAFSLQKENFDGTATTQTGTWKFAEGKETLLIELNGEPQTFKVAEMTDSKLILLPEGQKMKMEFSVKK